MLEPRKTLTESRVFNPVRDALWEGWGKATSYLSTLSDAELWHAAEWISKMGSTNCGWLEYHLRDDLRRHVEWEFQRRKDGGEAHSEVCNCFICIYQRHGRVVGKQEAK